MKQKDITVAGSLNEVLLIIDDGKEILHMDVENALEFAVGITETALRSADPPIKGFHDVEKKPPGALENFVWDFAAGCTGGFFIWMAYKCLMFERK